MLTNLSRVSQLRSLVKSNVRIISVRNFSDKNYSSDDEEKKVKSKPKDSKENKPSKTDRLNKLLFSMNTVDNYKLVKSVEIPKAGAKKMKLKNEKEKVKQAEIDKPKNIIQAAKNVASSLGGDIKQTESELLSKLLIHSDGVDPTQPQVKDKKSISLNDLIVGMKIDRATKSGESGLDSQTRSQYVKRALNRTNRSENRSFQGREDKGGHPERRPRQEILTPPKSSGSVKLFGETSMGIFKTSDTLKDSPDILETWSALQQRELKLAITHPPSNYFQKMILWTEQGKIWKFPIDNEQGLDEESKVYFADHVFIEQHLEPWCPTKGPIRHFMELVCVGLSKNPYITVKAKQDHINWFKEYFEQKKDLIKDLIVDQKDNKTNEIEKIN